MAFHGICMSLYYRCEYSLGRLQNFTRFCMFHIVGLRIKGEMIQYTISTNGGW